MVFRIIEQKTIQWQSNTIMFTFVQNHYTHVILLCCMFFECPLNNFAIPICCSANCKNRMGSPNGVNVSPGYASVGFLCVILVQGIALLRLPNN